MADDVIVKPIKDEFTIQKEFANLDGLVNVEFTSRILLGALHRQLEVNPLQYIYNTLAVKITPL